ncbi:MAG: FAD-binding oxidoreductase [Allosphingosinicella sp.]|uniref:FAD-binding oxidoreductase n=1 Tax=Allosphingosinicella sp. TaxID=2823234 RepID=UPI0039550CEA
MAQAAHAPGLIGRLADLLGPEGLITDAAECAFYAQDVFAAGPAPLAVIRPADKEVLAAAVALATGEGVAIVPRGGGMSYTQGYVPDAPGALIVDLGRMNRILAIDEEDMTATVEAGCTWEALHRALKPRRLRARAWGTLSGIKASIGGGMSQNGIFWGARDGTVANAALAFEVVLADGRIVSTGSDFFRPYGPDLTGLFACDTGALGIKATVTLQLVREGAAFAYGSYAFADEGSFLRAMSAVAREGLTSECFGFDPFLQAQRMKRDSLAKDAGQLLNMMKAQGSAWKALKEGAKVVAAGRSFLDDAGFSLHAVCEARHQAAADADLAAIADIAAAEGGRPVENSIPKVLRANPFPPVNSMVGPEGERWVPVHGFLPHSRLAEGWAAIQALFAGRAEEMERLGVGAGAMFAAVSPSCCLIEPVFFWPDALDELHRRSVEPAHLARLKGFARNPEARRLVEELREGVVDLFTRLGAAHLQIGRTYRLGEAHDPGAWALLKAVKQAVDPGGLMNPGSLGL